MRQIHSRLSFFFNSHRLFEEIAKFRAARRITRATCASTARRIEVVAAALHADRRMQRHGAAAGEQHRARCARGDGNGAGRHAIAAHQLDGRSPRAADRSRSRSRARSRITNVRNRVTNVIDPLGARTRRSAHRRDGTRKPISRRSPEYGGVVEAIEAGFFKKSPGELPPSGRSKRKSASSSASARDERTSTWTCCASQNGRGSGAPCRTFARAATRRRAGHAGTLAASLPRSKDNLIRLIDCVNAYATEGEIVEAWSQSTAIYRTFGF